MLNIGNIIGAVIFGIVAIGAAVGAIFYGATHQWAIFGIAAIMITSCIAEYRSEKRKEQEKQFYNNYKHWDK